jgi:hypothetical protein
MTFASERLYKSPAIGQSRNRQANATNESASAFHETGNGLRGHFTVRCRHSHLPLGEMKLHKAGT